MNFAHRQLRVTLHLNDCKFLDTGVSKGRGHSFATMSRAGTLDGISSFSKGRVVSRRVVLCCVVLCWVEEGCVWCEC